MTTKTTDTPTTLAADLVAALSELRTLGQDGSNPHFKSRYLTLQTLIEGVRPILARHNLALLQPVTADGASVTVTTLLLHTSGAEFSRSPRRGRPRRKRLAASSPTDAGTAPGACSGLSRTPTRTMTGMPPARRRRRTPRMTRGSRRCRRRRRTATMRWSPLSTRAPTPRRLGSGRTRRSGTRSRTRR